jgi:hypothetical protein
MFKSRRIATKAVFIIVLSFIFNGCQTTTHNHAAEINNNTKKPLPEYETIRIHSVSNDKFSLLRLGLSENACRDLKVNQTFSAGFSELRCLQGPEEILNSELLRLMIKYSIKKRLQYREGIYEIH